MCIEHKSSFQKSKYVKKKKKKFVEAKFEARPTYCWGQAKTWDQANFEAKSEARPTLRPDQANGAKPGLRVCHYLLMHSLKSFYDYLCSENTKKPRQIFHFYVYTKQSFGVFQITPRSVFSEVWLCNVRIIDKWNFPTVIISNIKVIYKIKKGNYKH